MRYYFICLCVLTIACGGCTTTNQSRNRDANAARLVADYRNRQQDRIDQLNNEYQQVFALEMAQLNALGKAEFNQQLSLQAAHLSEQILNDWKKQTLPTTFADACYSSLQNDYQNLEAVENQVESARQAYANSFNAISLDIKKLDAIESSLQSLAISASTRRELTTFFEELYNAYRQAQNQKEAAPKKAASQDKNPS